MFNLKQLEYDYDALEPYIDAKTMEIHHSKHHQAYVNNLNAAMESIKELDIEFYKKISKITKKDELAAAEYLVSHLENVPEKVRTAVRNNAGGHLNHSLFWKVLKPGMGYIFATTNNMPLGRTNQMKKMRNYFYKRLNNG